MTPSCPMCLRANQRSLVHQTGMSTVTIGLVEVGTDKGKHRSPGGTSTTRTYHCTNGHSWSETDKQPALGRHPQQ